MNGCLELRQCLLQSRRRVIHLLLAQRRIFRRLLSRLDGGQQFALGAGRILAFVASLHGCMIFRLSVGN